MKYSKNLIVALFAILFLVSILSINRTPIAKPEEELEKYVPNGPRVDEVVFKIITNPDAQYLALKSGEIDLMGWYLPPDKVEDAKADPNLIVASTGDAGFFYLAFNFRKAPTNDIAFRKAIAHLVDKDKIVNVLLKGLGIPLDNVVPPLFYGEWSNPDVPTYEYNPEKAKEILLNAGYKFENGKWYLPDGSEMPEMTIITPSYDPVRIEAGNLIAGAAQSIGLPINSQPVDFNTLVDLAFGDVSTGKEPEFDMYILGWGLGVDPDYLYDFFHSSQLAPWGANAPGIQDPELDEWLEKTMEETSRENVMEAMYKSQELLADKLPYVPLYERLAVFAARGDKWTGYVNGKGSGLPNFWTFMNVHPKDKAFGGTFVFGMLDDIKTTNPIIGYPEGTVWDWYVMGLIYDSLFYIDPITLEDKPMLAESWDIEEWEYAPGEKGLKITFHLVKNATWHDGLPVTAEDVKFTYEYCLKHEVPEVLPRIKYIVRMETPDPFTITLYLNTSSYWAFHWINTPVILPKHIWEKVENPYTYENPVPIGSGPFMWKERKPGEYIVLEYNPYYFKSARVAKIETTKAPTAAVVGDDVTYEFNVLTPEGKPAENAVVTLKVVKGGSEVLSKIADNLGGGKYKVTFNTGVLGVGDVDVVVEATYETEVTTFTARKAMKLTVVPEVYKELISKINALEEKISAQKATISELESKIGDVKTDLESQINALKGSLNTATTIGGVAVVIAIVAVALALMKKK